MQVALVSKKSGFLLQVNAPTNNTEEAEVEQFYEDLQDFEKTKIMASGPITSWEIDGETVETVSVFIFLGSKITAAGDFSHEMKRRLLLGRKVMTNLLWSYSVVSDSLWPHGLWHTRLLYLWNFLGKSTGLGCHFLLQGIFPTQGSNPGLPHWGQVLYHLSHQGIMTNLDSILKSRDIALPTKVHLVKAMVFPVVIYGCESWTVKKAEHQRIDAF